MREFSSILIIRNNATSSIKVSYKNLFDEVDFFDLTGG